MIRREIHGHELDNQPIVLRVLAVDAVQETGVCHQYRIERDDGAQVGYVSFHRNISEAEETPTNGISHESLLVVLMDQFKGLQDGPLACKEYGVALKKTEEVLAALHAKAQKKAEKATA
jgi:hypothetical protein